MVKIGNNNYARAITVFERFREKNGDKILNKEREIGKGKFIRFSVDFIELDGCKSPYNTALIEMPSGEIVNYPVELIRFDNKPLVKINE
jgi:hypothetical protein